MKRTAIILVVLSLLLLAACGVPNSYSGDEVPSVSAPPSQAPVAEASLSYRTFEETLQEATTDVVIAQYIGHKPFGQGLTEYEFDVRERVLGNAADTIFVYAESMNASVIGSETSVSYRPGDLEFKPKTDYLLALRSINSAYAKTQENGFTFIRNIVIDLNEPSNSKMYSEPLFNHTKDIDLSKNMSREQIISYVGKLTKNNLPVKEIIHSDAMEDIINGSSYILVVEINDPLSLSNEQVTTDWMVTDLYHCTVIQTLKGDVKEGSECVVTFFADTVLPGEKHIVAVKPLDEGDNWYNFTSKNSLFLMDQLDEISKVLSES